MSIDEELVAELRDHLVRDFAMKHNLSNKELWKLVRLVLTPNKEAEFLKRIRSIVREEVREAITDVLETFKDTIKEMVKIESKD